jgi:N-acetylmuramoyl-L-alanine amidase
MHESHHGIAMVVTAYALSFLMLVVGSDVFYNIKSAAAGLDNETDEEASELLDEDIESSHITDPNTMVLQTSMINPYGLGETTNANTLGLSSTVWQPSEIEADSSNGGSLSTEADELSLTEQMHQTKTQTKKSTKKAENSKDTTESLSVAKKDSSLLYDLTDEEVGMLERIVEAEASGEDMKGKILIANVIFNRIEDDDFPDTVKKVIFQEDDGEYQFSPISDERYWTVKVSDETEEAVQRALEGEDYSKGALYFMARKITRSKNARWFDQHLERLFKHGGHEFFK